MNLPSSWIFCLILYLFFSVAFTQMYKLATNKMKNAWALTALLQMIAWVSILVLMPFFKIQFSNDYRIYLVLWISIIFYALADRLTTNVRQDLEASAFDIVHQIYTIFLILLWFIFMKEPFIFSEFLWALLILFSNFLIFYKKGSIKFSKTIIYAIITNLCYAIAVFLDVNISVQFNLPFYVFLTIFIPAILIIIWEKIKFKELKKEFEIWDKKILFLTWISWGLLIFFLFRAYQLGQITIIAPLSALTAILNVIVWYIFLKEKNNLTRKIIAWILIFISIILINY